MSGPPNYTTTITPDKTAAECVQLLGHYGAEQATVFFAPDGVPTGLAFILDPGSGQRGYKIDVNFNRTQAILARQSPKTKADLAQAQRTAWRTLRDWLAYQLSMINTGLLEAEQALFSYEVDDQGRTRWDLQAEQRRSVTSGAVVVR